MSTEPEDSSATELLKSIPMLSDLNPIELNNLLRIAKKVKFAEGDVICRQGMAGDYLFIIEEGSARVKITNEAGQSIEVAVLSAGQMIGELSLIDTRPRSADVVADSALRGYRIERTKFNELRARRESGTQKVMLQVARTVCGRLRQVNGNVSRVIGGVPIELQSTAARPNSDQGKWRTFWSGVRGWMKAS